MGFEDCVRRLRIAHGQDTWGRGAYEDMLVRNLRAVARACEKAAEYERGTYECQRRVAQWGPTPTEERRASWAEAMVARGRMVAAEEMAAAARCALAAAKVPS